MQVAVSCSSLAVYCMAVAEYIHHVHKPYKHYLATGMHVGLCTNESACTVCIPSLVPRLLELFAQKAGEEPGNEAMHHFPFPV